MTTYHGIHFAVCIACGHKADDTTTLEIWNDQDGTCPECGGGIALWRMVNGQVVISESRDHGPMWLFEKESLVNAITTTTEEESTMTETADPAPYLPASLNEWPDEPVPLGTNGELMSVAQHVAIVARKDDRIVALTNEVERAHASESEEVRRCAALRADTESLQRETVLLNGQITDLTRNEAALREEIIGWAEEYLVDSEDINDLLRRLELEPVFEEVRAIFMVEVEATVRVVGGSAGRTLTDVQKAISDHAEISSPNIGFGFSDHLEANDILRYEVTQVAVQPVE
jgi:hypothetical protein